MDLLDEVGQFAPHGFDDVDFFNPAADLASSGSSSDNEHMSSHDASFECAPEEVREESSETSAGTAKKRGAAKSVSRKRKAPSSAAPKAKGGERLPADSVTVDREVLLTITSEEFDELVAGISARRRLSDAEQKEVRRQKRLIKNRESAALSRNRKKQALETLEEENGKLREELGVMKQFLERTNQMAAFMASLAAPVGASQRSGVGLLFVFVLSFGLFLNMPGLATRLGGAGGLVGAASMAEPLVAAGPNLRQLLSLDRVRVVEAVKRSACALDSTPSSSLAACNATCRVK
jgi:hypothetical protein